jgi:hypothetical protein
MIEQSRNPNEVTSACHVCSARSGIPESNPKVVDQCFKIHGRVRVVNGAGTVIWRIGTDRLLDVEDEELIPDNLGHAIYKKPGDVYGRDVFGDFEVCPFTKSTEGEMQKVCVESANHLVVKDNTH